MLTDEITPVPHEETPVPHEETLTRARALRDEYARAAALYAYRIERARARARVAEVAHWTAAYRRSTARCRVLGEIIRGQQKVHRR
jgi:hypothetical protein